MSRNTFPHIKSLTLMRYVHFSREGLQETPLEFYSEDRKHGVCTLVDMNQENGDWAIAAARRSHLRKVLPQFLTPGEDKWKLYTKHRFSLRRMMMKDGKPLEREDGSGMRVFSEIDERELKYPFDLFSPWMEHMLGAPNEVAHLYLARAKGYARGVLAVSHNPPSQRHYKKLDERLVEVNHHAN